MLATGADGVAVVSAIMAAEGSVKIFSLFCFAVPFGY